MHECNYQDDESAAQARRRGARDWPCPVCGVVLVGRIALFQHLVNAHGYSTGQIVGATGLERKVIRTEILRARRLGHHIDQIVDEMAPPPIISHASATHRSAGKRTLDQQIDDLIQAITVQTDPRTRRKQRRRLLALLYRRRLIQQPLIASGDVR